jgi:hypothetical protein
MPKLLRRNIVTLICHTEDSRMGLPF